MTTSNPDSPDRPDYRQDWSAVGCLVLVVLTLITVSVIAIALGATP